jgi:hypothetical protein
VVGAAQDEEMGKMNDGANTMCRQNAHGASSFPWIHPSKGHEREKAGRQAKDAASAAVGVAGACYS